MTTSTFGDQAYDHILGQLFRRELQPGDLLDRKQIAQELDISLIPVSDAVQRLTHEGLLTTRRRQCTFVCSPSIEDVRGQLLLREALECQSARLYAGEKINAARQRLLPLAQAVDKAAASGKQICLDSQGAGWLDGVRRSDPLLPTRCQPRPVSRNCGDQPYATCYF